MSNFTGVTFAKQKVTPSYDAIIRRALLSDGTLTGCGMSYSGSTLTMAAGQLMVCGRQIIHPASQNWAVTGQTSGFARLVLTIDLTRTSTKDTFDQVQDSIQYATDADGFVGLEQQDINTTGTKYQIAVCVVSLGPGGITGIVSKLEKCEGGGAGLNFKVVGGTTQPVSPTENTIWVNTSVPIPSWAFSATEPESPAAGMVWFPVGTSSQVAFNAIKKNGIQVYPLSANQYVGSQWVEKEAEIYQDVEWTELWAGLLGHGRNLLGTPNFVLETHGAGAEISPQRFAGLENGSYSLDFGVTPSWGNVAVRFPTVVDFENRGTLAIKYIVNQNNLDSNVKIVASIYDTTGTNLRASVDLADIQTDINTMKTATIDISEIPDGLLTIFGNFATGNKIKMEIVEIIPS